MASETSPLLAGTPKKSAGIPYGQLALLCYARWIDGWFFFTIFPYIARMIQDTGIPAEHVGYYSGIIEASYSLVEVCTLLSFWTGISDTWGRRPVMVICLAGLAVSGTLFGFSTHVWQMIACRALSGAFSGCVGAMRVMLSEMSTQETEAQMLSIWASADSIGSLIAPIAGGLLARPADNFSFFEGSVLFRNYPYLLPSLVMGALGGSCSLLCYLWLKETLKVSSDDTKLASDEQTIMYTGLVKLPGVAYVLLNSMVLQALVFAWTAIEPIFCFTDMRSGGLGLSVRQISLVLACTAVTSTFILLTLFPYCQRRFRIGGCLLFASIASVLAGALPPLANAALRDEAQGIFWSTLAASLVVSSFQSAFGRSATQLMVNNMAPTAASLGKLSSLSLTINFAGRTLSPALASAIYASGVSRHILNGQLGWAAFVICSVIYAVSLVWYPKQADTRQRAIEQ